MREASPSGESATVKAALFGPIELTGSQRVSAPVTSAAPRASRSLNCCWWPAATG